MCCILCILGAERFLYSEVVMRTFAFSCFCSVFFLIASPVHADDFLDNLLEQSQVAIEKGLNGVRNIINKGLDAGAEGIEARDQRLAAERAEEAEAYEQSLTLEQRIAVQQSLNGLGYAIGTPDGEFGPRTRQGIKSFQASLESTETGQLSAAQGARLLGSSSPTPLVTLEANPEAPEKALDPAEASEETLDPVETSEQTLDQAETSPNAPPVIEVVQANAPSINLPPRAATDLEAAFQGQVFAATLNRGHTGPGMLALQKQRFLDKNADTEATRRVLLSIAKQIMAVERRRASILTTFRQALIDETARQPREQRITPVFHDIYLADLLDHPRADDLARTVLQLDYDLTYLEDILNLDRRENAFNQVTFGFFNPARMRNEDPALYLANHVDKIRDLVDLLIRNLPDDIYLNGPISNIAVDLTQQSIQRAQRQKRVSFLAVWPWRNGGSGKAVSEEALAMQIYEPVGALWGEPDNIRTVGNGDLYQWPARAHVADEIGLILSGGLERFLSGQAQSRTPIGQYILDAMQLLDELLPPHGASSMLVAIDRNLDLEKAVISEPDLQAIADIIRAGDGLGYILQARLDDVASIDLNKTITMQLEFETLSIYHMETGSVIAPLGQEAFPLFSPDLQTESALQPIESTSRSVVEFKLPVLDRRQPTVIATPNN